MKTIVSAEAWYPQFSLGDGPRAVRCSLTIVEANGRLYLKTPFAMLDTTDESLLESCFGRGYYRTEAECQDYLAQAYPHWQAASPIMEALITNLHHYGNLVGAGRLADKIGHSTDDLYQIARGAKRFSPKAVRAAVKALAAN